MWAKSADTSVTTNQFAALEPHQTCRHAEGIRGGSLTRTPYWPPEHLIQRLAIHI